MDNKRISTENLDFDGIKNELKSFLMGQDKFSDYNFEGSGLSVLLDVLSYNTHYNALYTNLAVNEAFLDSASKRNSVVSKAKELGYVPTSYRAATTQLNVLFSFLSSFNDSYIELPKFTRFYSKGDNVVYNFYTTQSYIAYRNNKTYSFKNIEVKQGTPLQYRYVVANVTLYTITNKNVDITTLKVTVQDNLSSSTYEIFKSSNSILELDANHLVYFVKEIDNEYYQIEFGDGVVGKKLTVGNVVTLEYMTCDGESAIELTSFSYGGKTFSTAQSVIVNVNTPSFGGSGLESIESIKYNAPHYYTAQNRCVTAEDYKTLILSNFPETKSVIVWGGEENVAPVYGNIYISIIPKSGETLTTTEKNILINDILKPRQMIATHNVFVNPFYIKLLLNVTYYYNPNKTNLYSNDISQIILNKILDYNQENLINYGGVFRQSNVTNIIDNCDASIQNSNINAKMLISFDIYYNKPSTYKIILYNPIFNYTSANEAILSNGLVVSDNPNVTSYIDDVPITGTDQGNLRLFYYVGSEKKLLRYVGTVNYLTGEILIENIVILNTTSFSLDLMITPNSVDIISKLNQVVMLQNGLINITAVNLTSGENYKFSAIH